MMKILNNWIFLTFRYATLAISICFITPLAYALDGDASQSVDGDGFQRLEEILVTARKREENVQDIPDTITVIGGDFFDNIGGKDLADLNRSLTNFWLRETQQPGTSFISLRGVTQQRFQEVPVAIVIDGVQLTSAYQVTQSLYNVESIEVLRGPQGSLYGRNAIGGAINITTRQPGNELEGLFKVGVAENDTYNTQLRLSGPLAADRSHFQLVAVHRETDGTLENTFLNKGANRNDTDYFSGRVTFDISSTLSADLRASYEKGTAGAAWFVNLPTADINQTNVDIVSGDDGEATRKLADFSLQLTWDLGFAELISTTARTDVDDNFFQDIDFESFAAITATQFVDVKSISQDIKLVSTDSDRLRWMVGGYYADIDQDISTYLQLAPCFLLASPCALGALDQTTALEIPFGINENNNETMAMFGQVDYNTSDKLTLALGLRYDRDKRTQKSLTEGGLVRGKTFSDWQPKISLAYQLNETSMTYFTVSRGFRSGAFNGTNYIKRGYDAETLWSYEVGFKSQLLDDRLRLNSALFHMDYDDRQEYVLEPGTGTQTLFNIPKSRITGFELDGFMYLGKGFELSAGVGILDTEVERGSPEALLVFGTGFEGNELPNVPTFSANVGLQQNISLSDELELTWRLDWSLRDGVHWSLGNENDEQDAVNILNAQMIFDYNQFKIRAYSNNLLDEEYYTEAALPGFGAITPLPAASFGNRRETGIEFTYNF